MARRRQPTPDGCAAAASKGRESNQRYGDDRLIDDTVIGF